ncbi:MAG: excinuclease subunit UvrA [Bacteroidota bacterium]|jgi:excinuclease ABC subunit A
MAKKKEVSTKALPQISEYEIEHLSVYGARVHNLKNIDVHLPRNKLVVITGVSGSGKSSLAFDTIYAEGQRRYMESFSAYARQFIGSLERPDVDKVTGLSPVIAIEQKTTNKNPRSTVGTVTEIYDFIRLLYARVGEAYSYATGKKMVRYSEEQIIEHILTNYNEKKIAILTPQVKGRKGHYRELFEQVRKQGFTKVRVDGIITDITDKMQVDRFKIHDIEIIIDRLDVTEDEISRIKTSSQTAMKMGKGEMMILDYETNKIERLSKTLMCADTGISYEEPSPNSFSFNSPYGACPHCKGLGSTYKVNEALVIPDDKKSIQKGGIIPLGEYKENFVFMQLNAMAKTHKFNLTDPINTLPFAVLNMILHGNITEKLTVPESQKTASWYNKNDVTFEGVIPMLERYFGETTSESIRKWAEEFMELKDCTECNGTRLRKESLYFKINNLNIAELSNMDISDLHPLFEGLYDTLNDKQKTIAKELLKEIATRLQFLLDVGLDYLNLNRPSRTLSGGESQRIRLATQIGSQLTGITYILDEPSIGLHQRDNQKLIQSLKKLTALGNSVLVVEHDEEIMQAADFIVDIGPKAGEHGGRVMAQGTYAEILKQQSVTTNYLGGHTQIEIPKKRREGTGEFIELKGCKGNNLKNVNVKFPLGKMTVVTGVSGSGKSTIINETLYPLLMQHCYGSKYKPLAFDSISSLKNIDKVIEIDQSPIGRSPRSNAATYINVFSDIRNLFAMLPEAKIRGYKSGRFSFNVKGGRCDVCEGGGMKMIEMNFLPDVEVLCEKCLGKRFNRETCEIKYKGKSISDVLDMTVEDAVPLFENIPTIHRRIKTLAEVGLGYIKLGQSAITLSGGEAQRVKLAAELCKIDTGNTFYILDEPTTGLHFEDIRVLMDVVQKLVEKKNTVLIIEHNLDVVKLADYIIDIGPEGGNGGGQVLFEGTPEELIKTNIGHTSKYLKMVMKK